MSVYNGERFLSKAIESILGQSFTDFEFLIRNDSSTDNSEDIIKSFNDGRIKYICHERENLSQALNYLCHLARGKYIARMDDDDVSLPNRFQEEFDFLERNKDFVLVSSPMFYIDDNDIIIGRSFPFTNESILKNRTGLICHPCVMFRRDAYLKTQGYPNTRRAEDVLLWSKLGKMGRFKNLHKPLIKYRLLNDSLGHGDDMNSPYFSLMVKLKDKMCADEKFEEQDIKLFNEIARLIPRINTTHSNNNIQGNNSEMRFFSFMKSFLGEDAASNIIISLRNFYGLHIRKFNH